MGSLNRWLGWDANTEVRFFLLFFRTDFGKRKWVGWFAAAVDGMDGWIWLYVFSFFPDIVGAGVGDGVSLL